LPVDAALWLASKAGLTPELSSLAIPSAVTSARTDRLTEAPYLAALGYLADIRWAGIPSTSQIAPFLNRVAKRAPHTFERHGIADDPLCLVGLYLLARATGNAAVVETLRPWIAETANDDQQPISSYLLIALADGATALGMRSLGTAQGVVLALSILSYRANPSLGTRLFPTIGLKESEDLLLTGVCSGTTPISGDFDAMLVLVALELLVTSEASRSVHSVAALEGHSPPQLIAPPNKINMPTEITPIDFRSQDSLLKNIIPRLNSNLPVFISYAHRDNDSDDPSKRWLDRLLEHLGSLSLQNLVSTWSDKEIEAGEHWHESIQAALSSARAAVLLISPAYLNSKYIRNSELPILLRRAKDDGVLIIPILLRYCLFEETRFRFPDPQYGPEEFSLASIQAANSPTSPLNALSEHEQDKVLLLVARRLLKVIEGKS